MKEQDLEQELNKEEDNPRIGGYGVFKDRIEIYDNFDEPLDCLTDYI
jgi:hypothetical protein